MVKACVLIFVVGFSSNACADLLHIGEPDATNGNSGWLSAIRLHAYYPQENHYSSAVARFSFPERRLGDEFRAVVWGQKPGGQAFVASDWQELLDPSRQHLGESIGGFFVDVWDSNPRGFYPARIGNVYHGRKPLIGGTLAALGGSSFYQWGTKEWGLPTHTAHFDISDITFEPGIEYWISLRVYVRDGGGKRLFWSRVFRLRFSGPDGSVGLC